MVKERSWQEFRNTGLFWLINQTLHLFGWAIVMEFEKDVFVRAYPARVKFRGFDEQTNTEGYIKVSEYLRDNAEKLARESKE